MAISVVDGFVITNATPVDARQVFTSSAPLFASGTTDILPATRRYIGMEVYIVPQTCSYTLVSGEPRVGGGINNAVWVTGSATASYALNTNSSSYALSASYATTSSFYSYVYYNVTQSYTIISSASYASSSTHADFASSSLSASWASESLSSSYAVSASWADYANPIFTGKSDYYAPIWLNNELTATSSIYDNGNVGIGIISDSNIKLNVYYDKFANNNGTYYSNYNLLDLDSTESRIAGATAIYGKARGIGSYNSTHLSNGLAGVVGIAENNGTGSIASIVGLKGITILSGDAIVTSSYGGYFSIQNTSVLGTASNGYGIYIDPTYGKFNISYGIYQSGSSINYFEGKVGIGVISASLFQLETAGDIGPSTDITYDLGSLTYRWRNIFGQSISGSLYGTSSWAISSSWAPSNDLSAYLSASWTGSNSSTFYGTASYSTNSLHALSASWAPSNNLSLYLSSSEFNNWTGSSGSHFYGTSSYSEQALSASYAPIQNIDLSSYLSSSQFTNWVSSSTNLFSGTASYSLNSLSASWAPTQNIDLSSYLSSSQFNNWTGSSGSVFYGSSSYSTNASYALSASYALFARTASFSVSSSYALSASYALSSSYAVTASYVSSAFFSQTASYAYYAETSSWTLNIDGANVHGIVDSSSYAQTASYALNAAGGTTLNTGSTYPITSSWAETASYITASGVSGKVEFSNSASWAETSSYTSIINIQQLITTQSLFSTQSLFATQSIFAISASWASESISSSYALSASYAPQIQFGLQTGSTYPITASWSNNAISASYAPTQNINLTNYLSSSQFTAWVSSSTNLFSGTASYSLSTLTASYVSASLPIFTGKTDHYAPIWLNNNLTSTSSIYDDGNVGIGILSDADIKLNVYSNLFATNNATYYSIYNLLELDSTASRIAGASAVYGKARGINSYNSTHATNALAGVFGIAENNGTGSVNTIVGLKGITTLSGDGIVTNSYAGYFAIQNISSIGTASNGYGIYIDVPYGIFGTTYGIFQTGSNFNFFDANVGIGVQSASLFKLQVEGNIGPNTDNIYDLGSTANRWKNIYGTASYALQSISASYAPQILTGLQTGSTYPITSSWSDNSVSASYAPIQNIDLSSYLSSSQFTSWVSSSTNLFSGTASYANTALSASYAPTQNINLNNYLSASQFTSWVSSSTNLFSGTASYALRTLSSSYAISSSNSYSASYSLSSSYSATSSYASSAFYSITSSYSYYAVTSSYSSTSSYLKNEFGAVYFISSSITGSGTSSVIFVPTASYDSFFTNYMIKGGLNRRAGQISSIWDASSVTHDEATTADIGDTHLVVFNVILTGSNAVLQVENASPTVYQIKASITTM